MKSRRMLLGLAIVVLAVTQGSALPQDTEPSYSPDGAWLGTATIAGVPNPIPYMDIFFSDTNSYGRSGGGLCTLSIGKFPSPMGLVSMTQSAHANWVRTAKNTFAFTAWRILLDENGRAVGTAKFWGTIIPGANETFTGTMNVQYYTADGTAFGAFTGTTVGRRIAIEQQ